MQCVYLAFFCFVLSSWFQSHVSWQQSVLLLVSSHLFILDPCSSLFFQELNPNKNHESTSKTSEICGFSLVFPCFSLILMGFSMFFLPSQRGTVRCAALGRQRRRLAGLLRGLHELPEILRVAWFAQRWAWVIFR